MFHGYPNSKFRLILSKIFTTFFKIPVFWSSADFRGRFRPKGRSRKASWYHTVYNICSF